MPERLYLNETQTVVFQPIIGPNGEYDQCSSKAISCIVYRKIEPESSESSYGMSISGTPGPGYTVKLDLNPICNQDIECINAAFNPHQGPIFSEDGEFLGINDSITNNTGDGILKDRFYLDLPLNKCQQPENSGAWCVSWNGQEQLVGSIIQNFDSNARTITIPETNEFFNTLLSISPYLAGMVILMVVGSYISNKSAQKLDPAIGYAQEKAAQGREALAKSRETLSKFTNFFGRGNEN